MAPTVFVEYSRQKESKKYLQEVSGTVMGKTHKISRGYLTGFVPDYRHGVEVMGESEGFGSSGRVDTEMTVSEGSCAPKRKCISLNVDSCDGFNIPLQVHSLAKMSRYEKKELELRLRSELEQVQILQQKLPMRFRNSDIGSCNERIPPGRNIQQMNRGLSGRFDSGNQAPPQNALYLKLMKQCEVLLKRLISHKHGWVFSTPVDIVKLNIPDYFTVIKQPMDLGTVKSKIAAGKYSSPWDFVADVRLTFSNAKIYNPPLNDVHVMADQLSKYFEVRWKVIEKKLPVHDSVPVPVPVQLGVSREVEIPKPTPQSKKRKLSPTIVEQKSEPIKRGMTSEEKHILNKDLESLIAELPDHIIDFLKEHSSGEGENCDDEIEVEIDKLNNDTLFRLRKLVDDYMREKQISRTKAEPCEIEILNEPGLSNSSTQPCKGNDPVDEDVDIGGNDPPISSYPPVEIDKDTAHRSSKCSSSSSSSSDSGSSSSDSDSGSSSSSESDGARASPPINASKETLVAGADRPTNGSVDPHDGNHPVSGLGQDCHVPQLKPASVEAADSLQEGESDPSERLVSQDKVYRAALLKSRFADTILKAQEKTLIQGEKGDPEKLRREREELERQQREEKARLQAEARAAEEARRQAEADAAAEAKRKRELEREAARQALLQMEKTVEINENSQFLEDLEMLRTVPEDFLPSVEDKSPDHSLDCGFKFQGSNNPLEQLGLYMKLDDDDEDDDVDVDVEEVEPEPNKVPVLEPEPEPTNDVDEGEVD